MRLRPSAIDLTLLCLILAGLFLLLLARGLNLGFFGDVLAYDYHLAQAGVIGGSHWLVTEHWSRHLLGAPYPAVIQVLANGTSTLWYATAFLSHYTAAVCAYLFITSFTRGQARALALAAALIFAVSLLDTRANFEFPTLTVRNLPLGFAWLALWAYLAYVRGGRQYALLGVLAFGLFVLAFAAYEPTALFFFLLPVIAWFARAELPPEQREAGWPWARRALIDMLPYGGAVVIYVYLLAILFPGTGGIRLSPGWIIEQGIMGIRVLFDPRPAVEALNSGSPVIIAVGGLVVAALLWWRLRAAQLTRFALAQTVTVAAGVTLVTIGGAAPTSFGLAENVRLLYPAMFAAPLLLIALGLLVGEQLKLRSLARMGAAGAAGGLVALGAAAVLAAQTEYAQINATRTQSLAAIQTALPTLALEARPYLLVVTDLADPEVLALNMGDINFPQMLDRLYSVYGMLGDGVYPRAEAAPPCELRIGCIVVDEAGLHSPLRPDLIIDPAQIVIIRLQVSGNTTTGQVIDVLTAAELVGTNVVIAPGTTLRTNRALIGGG